MTLTRTSTVPEVALGVGAQRSRRGIRAVLAGGACVAIYTGTCTSRDADFVLQGLVTERALDDAMRELGFTRSGDRHVPPHTVFFVEFPPGPLSIGDDLAIEPVPLASGELSIPALSPTDSCRDRLAAVYHWDDRQALQLAVEIATMQEVGLAAIRARCAEEGMAAKCDWFIGDFGRRRRDVPTAR